MKGGDGHPVRSITGYRIDMSDLPTPTSVLFDTLIWFGVPALLFVPITLALWLAEWFKTGQQVRRGAINVAQRVRQFWDTRPLLRVFGYIFWQGAIAAFVYASFRLGQAMAVPDATGRNIADGKSFTWSELWGNLTDYSAGDQLALKAFWLTIGYVVAINVAYLAGSRLLVRIVQAPVPITSMLAFGAAALIGVVGLMVLSLATWMNSPGYNIEMVALYAFWVVLLAGFAISANAIVTMAGKIYPAPD